MAFQKMTSSLRQGRDSAREIDWLKSRQNELNFLMRGERDSADMAAAVLGYLVEAVHGGSGRSTFMTSGPRNCALPPPTPVAGHGNRRHASASARG